MTIHIVAAFTIGFSVAVVICLAIHQDHKESWQDEYRRLMAGIDGALIALHSSNRPRISYAIKILSDTYNGDK